jgi:hypothetical protein
VLNKNLLHTRRGTNQYKVKSRVTVGGMCVALIILGTATFGITKLTLHALGATQAFANEIINVEPKEIINPVLELDVETKVNTSATPTPTPTPTGPTDLENIVAYIARVFEPEGKHIVVRAINCFYSESGLRENAVGQNSDGPKSKDHGVAQLNDYWHKLSEAEKTEYKANIDRAYKIYKGRGNNFDAWYGRGCR